jgi:hypothetical protein
VSRAIPRFLMNRWITSDEAYRRLGSPSNRKRPTSTPITMEKASTLNCTRTRGGVPEVH